jgi:hypothetical protein
MINYKCHFMSFYIQSSAINYQLYSKKLKDYLLFKKLKDQSITNIKFEGFMNPFCLTWTIY